MKFQTSTIVAILLAATAYAAPATRHQTRNPAAILTARDSVNDCGESSIINTTSGGSPLASDCQQIAINIAGGRTWTVQAMDKQHQLVQFGTCAFGIKNNSAMSEMKIGNQDIIDLITSSLEFVWYGLIGSEGVMDCQTTTIGEVSASWGIYHT